MKYRKIAIYNTPWVLWGMFILYMLLMPGDKIPAFRFNLIIPADKIVHFGLFFILQLCVFYAVINQSRMLVLRALVVAFISVVLYGILTEIMQGFFTASRNADVWDVFANTGGAFAASLFLHIVPAKLYLTKS